MRIPLNGYVVPDDDAWIYQWFGYSVFSPATVRQALKDNPQGEELVLEINSGGGSVFAGDEIYSVLRASPVTTRGEVQSVSASAASLLMLGCDSVWLSPVAQVMIHLPSLSTEGDRNVHNQSIKVLDSVTESILNAYVTKSKGKRTRDEFRAMMTSTTWMSAQEAIDTGIADGILYKDGEGAEAGAPLPGNIVNAIGGGLRALAGAGGGLPDPEQLRAEYRQMQRNDPTAAEPEQNPGSDPQSDPAGTEPVNHTDGWQAQARLDIEKNRYRNEGGKIHA